MRKKLFLIILSLLTAQFIMADNDKVGSSAQANGFNLPDFSPIYDSVGKAVVNVNVTQVIEGQMSSPFMGDPMFDFFFHRALPPEKRQYKTKGLGSGFIISNDGYILTNAHVVVNASEVKVKLNDKRELKAQIVGVDPETDVALLRIKARDLPTVKIGDPNKMKPGNWVLAIGSPFSLENTITHGIISALSRDLSDDKYVPYIQTDVPINPGNSGGPLINLKGEVIGINAQIYSKNGGYMGISFAIPIDYAIKVADQLKANGKVSRGRLGIGIQGITDDLAKSFGLKEKKGALVSSVEPNSAGDAAGIEVGDIILKVDNVEIDHSGQLPRIIGSAGVNKKINLQIWRNGKLITLTAVTQSAKPKLGKVEEDNLSKSKSVKPLKRLGISVHELTDREQLPQGVKYALIVQEVNQEAANAGLIPGDLIIGVGNHSITSLNQFNTLIDKAKNNNVVALKVLRNQGMGYMLGLFIPVPINDK